MTLSSHQIPLQLSRGICVERRDWGLEAKEDKGKAKRGKQDLDKVLIQVELSPSFKAPSP